MDGTEKKLSFNFPLFRFTKSDEESSFLENFIYTLKKRPINADLLSLVYCLIDEYTKAHQH